jgi:hypothetical protein
LQETSVIAASTAKGYVREGRKIYEAKEGSGAALVAAQAKGECSSMQCWHVAMPMTSKDTRDLTSERNGY